MRVFKLIFKNSLRHSLRTSLTILGVALAILAFGVVRTLITAWYQQSRNAAPDRLITRNAVSLTFELPIAYMNRIAQVDGVKSVSHASWFDGVYIDQKNFFPRFAVDMATYFPMYPEYVIDSTQWRQVMAERNAAIAGAALAEKYGWKIGDVIRITGTIYPGDWDFVIRGIYHGKDPSINENTLFFHYDYLDQKVARDMPGREGYVGTFVIQVSDPSRASEISQRVDALFENSLAETLTETEESFRLGFVAMSGAIITGIRIVSILIIGVVLLVLANTIAMAVRERMKEYAVLKTLGFSRWHLVGLIAGESLMIAALGTALGLIILFPAVGGLKGALADFFPNVLVEPITVAWSTLIAIGVGLIAALVPLKRVLTATIVDGLRQMG